jgi:Cdc6-like AAA superfamily ATPase
VKARLREEIQGYARVGKLKHVVAYSKTQEAGLDAMATAAAARLRAILAKDFPLRAVPTPLAAEAAAHNALCARMSRGFVARPHYFEALDAAAQQRHRGASPIMAVVGRAGSGKTALLANWLRRNRSSDSSTGP